MDVSKWWLIKIFHPINQKNHVYWIQIYISLVQNHTYWKLNSTYFLLFNNFKNWASFSYHFWLKQWTLQPYCVFWYKVFFSIIIFWYHSFLVMSLFGIRSFFVPALFSTKKCWHPKGLVQKGTEKGQHWKGMVPSSSTEKDQAHLFQIELRWQIRIK